MSGHKHHGQPFLKAELQVHHPDEFRYMHREEAKQQKGTLIWGSIWAIALLAGIAVLFGGMIQNARGETARRQAPIELRGPYSPSRDLRGLSPISQPSRPSKPLFESRGAYAVQIASLPTRELAIDEWVRLRHRHAEAFTGARVSYESANLGQRGTWHRVVLGYFTNQRKAGAWCNAYHSAGGECLVRSLSAR